MKVSQLFLDTDARLMENAFKLVDSQVVFLNEVIAEDLRGEGDSAFCDQADYLHGFGFVAGQHYVTATCAAFKMDKQKAFAICKQTNGISTAALVDAVANYWKHSEEWDFDKLGNQQKKTIATIKTVGIEVTGPGGWVCANVLHKMGLKNFVELTPLLKQWSDAVEAAQK